MWAELQTTKCRTEETVDLTNVLVLSQEDTPQTHRMVREISCEIDVLLRCYEITTKSLVVAFYWNIV